MPRAILAGAVLLAAACATSSTGPSSGPPQAAGAEDGRALFAAKCAGCHDLPEPKAHTDADWEKTVRRMVDQKGAKVTAAEQAQILAYLKLANPRE